MTSPSSDAAREATRQADGKFGTQERPEADLGIDLLADARAAAGRLEADLDAHRALVHRLEAYDQLKDLPDDCRVSTLMWDDEPNGDDTFDIQFDGAYGPDGWAYPPGNPVVDEFRDSMGHESAPAAGWFDEKGSPRTAFDAWREDPSNFGSPILMKKVHDWHRDLVAIKAAEAAAAVDDSAFKGSGWGPHRPVAQVTDVSAIRVGDVLAEHSEQFGSRNLIGVTVVDARRGVIHGVYVDPVDPNRKRTPSDLTIANWDFDLAKGNHFTTSARTTITEDEAGYPTEHDLNEAWGV